MVNERSLANLEKGRKSKHKRNTSKGRKTWQDLIREFGDTACDLIDANGKRLAPGKTWRQAMIESGFKHAMLGNAAIYKELMQRDEPQDIGVIVKKMSDDELREYIAQQLGIAVTGN